MMDSGANSDAGINTHRDEDYIKLRSLTKFYGAAYIGIALTMLPPVLFMNLVSKMGGAAPVGFHDSLHRATGTIAIACPCLIAIGCLQLYAATRQSKERFVLAARIAAITTLILMCVGMFEVVKYGLTIRGSVFDAVFNILFMAAAMPVPPLYQFLRIRAFAARAVTAS